MYCACRNARLDGDYRVRYFMGTRERRMIQPMKIDGNSCINVREVTEA